jgi:hypothetical protein
MVQPSGGSTIPALPAPGRRPARTVGPGRRLPRPCCGSRLRDVLLGYLRAEGALPWPGSDGTTTLMRLRRAGPAGGRPARRTYRMARMTSPRLAGNGRPWASATSAWGS